MGYRIRGAASRGEIRNVGGPDRDDRGARTLIVADAGVHNGVEDVRNQIARDD